LKELIISKNKIEGENVMAKIAFLFSGQGAQYFGMMHDLYVSIPQSKALFDIADNVLGRSISKLCFEGPQDELNLTHNTQPCLLAADLAAYYAITSFGIKPDVVAGFSLGEYAALVAAGVMGVEDAFSIIQLRADAMQNAVPVGQGAMAVTMKLDEDAVRELCEKVEGYVEPANFNCPGQIVVSGEARAVDELIKISKIKKIKAMKLPVSAPFHCKLMQPAADKLRKPLASIKMNDPIYPVYMNVDAQPISTSVCVTEKLILQAKSPVLWEQTIRNMFEAGIETYVELGPGKTLISFVKKTIEGIKVLQVENMDTLRDTVKMLSSLM
jgi:[acyl-carrier-protein] S-malonyltransferase